MSERILPEFDEPLIKELLLKLVSTKEGIGLLALIFGFSLKLLGVNVQWDILHGKIVFPRYSRDETGRIIDSDGFQIDEATGRKIIGYDRNGKPVFAGSIAGAPRG